MMTYEEAKQCLSEMESRYDDGFSSLDRTHLNSLYFALFGKSITNKGCSNCYRDAFIEINIKLKNLQAMPKKSEFVLKPGAIITFFGEPKCYTNANMTDDAALRFLSLNPRNERLFEMLPADWKNRIKVSDEPTETTTQESEKDELIARLTAENESLKKEIKSLKAPSSSKKGKKKSEPEAPAEKPDASTEESATINESSGYDNSSDVASAVDSEVSVEDADEAAVED